MRRFVLVLAVFVMACGVVFAASKVGTFGAPNSSGTAPLEVDSDRAISVASDATMAIAGNVTISSAKVTTGINWTDASLFPQAYSGINWVDKPHICMSATGVMSSDADGVCP